MQQQEKEVGFIDIERFLRQEYDAGDWAVKGTNFHDWSACRAMIYLADMLRGGAAAEDVRRRFFEGQQ